MSERLRKIIRQHSMPLQPIPTDTAPKLTALPNIKAVLFDVYGTMIISASGDVGSAEDLHEQQALREALTKVNIEVSSDWSPPAEGLPGVIQQYHQQLKAAGTEYPEIEIRDVWRTALEQWDLWNHNPEVDLEQLAIEYEVRTNPTWRMPFLKDCLKQLQSTGRQLGIISNAQFFTLELFPSLFGGERSYFGFHPDLQVYSFEYLQAKPGLFLYEEAKKRLQTACGITPEETLYVGNDMLKDIYPANVIGFRTALFAGDARSLRWREDDERVQNLQPDLVLTSLDQLPQCLEDSPH